MFAVTPSPRPRLSLPLWLIACVLLPALLGACGGSSNPPEAPAEPERVTAVIGPAGGTVTGPDGAQVVIPPGALRGNTTIGIARSSAGAPVRDAFWPAPAATYEFTPHGIAFETPVTIRLPVPAGTTGPTAWMASTDADWQESEATLAGGFASVRRNTFSWGMVIGACSTPANAPPNPDRCFSPRGHTSVVANPGNALTLTGYSNAHTSSGGSYRLDAAATLTFTAVYNLWPSCASVRVTMVRRQLDRHPQVVETLYDQANIGLTQGAHGGRGAGGTTVLPVLSLSHLDQGRHVVATYVACQRGDGFQARYYDATVINVAVPVPTTTQTIGGNVSGLAGTVVLRNNGADDLAVSADGPFTFPTPLATGVPFNVTVGTQPAGQTCTVQNGSGTANADVNNVAVNCSAGSAQAWQGATLIETNDLARAFNPVVATDSQGNAFAVWAQGNGSFDNIWAARYTPGGGWGAPQVIDDHSGNATEPQIAVDSAGNAVAIWVRENIVSRRGLVAASYTAGTWGAPQDVEGNAGHARAPQIGMDASGAARAIWIQHDGNFERVRSARLQGGSWDSTGSSIDGGTGDASDAQIQVFANGSALAVWTQISAGVPRVWHNRFNGVGWSTADLLDDNNTSFSLGAPALAADATGNTLAVWSQGTATTSSTVYARRYAGGTWGAAEVLSGGGTDNSARARVAMNANGTATAVWQESLADGLQTWARRRVGAGAWGAAVRLDTPLGASDSEGEPQVAMDPAGNATVVWSHTLAGGNHRDLYGSHHRVATGSWSAPALLDAVNTGGVNRCSVAMDANGNAIVVWDQDTVNARLDIWANVFR
ncbi:hypothetical protein [Hydrogenophaga sp. ANAO-22]|uniref:hypothetical protein n=1 Tax=Hydrogenophaga sp. ANAO-22 TaxID=3166645 RepID=UPI0036D3EE82